MTTKMLVVIFYLGIIMKIKNIKRFKSIHRTKDRRSSDIAKMNMAEDKLSTAYKIDKALVESIDNGRMIDPSEAFEGPEDSIGYATEGGSTTENSMRALSLQAREAALVGVDYQREFIYKMLHRYLLRGIPQHMIAKAFNVSRQTVWRWSKDLKRRFVEVAEDFDFTPHVGETIEYFKFLSEEATAVLMNRESTNREKLFAINSLLSIKAEERKFFDTIGFYDSNRFTGKKTINESQESAETLKGLVNEFAGLFDKKKSKKVANYPAKMKELAEDTKRKAVNLQVY